MLASLNSRQNDRAKTKLLFVLVVEILVLVLVLVFFVVVDVADGFVKVVHFVCGFLFFLVLVFLFFEDAQRNFVVVHVVLDKISPVVAFFLFVRLLAFLLGFATLLANFLVLGKIVYTSLFSYFFFKDAVVEIVVSI